MFKVNSKDTRIFKVNDKVKNKDTVDVVKKKKKNISFFVTVSLLLTVNCRLRFYIWVVNWVTHLGVVYSGRGGGCINGVLR